MEPMQENRKDFCKLHENVKFIETLSHTKKLIRKIEIICGRFTDRFNDKNKKCKKMRAKILPLLTFLRIYLIL